MTWVDRREPLTFLEATQPSRSNVVTSAFDAISRGKMQRHVEAGHVLVTQVQLPDLEGITESMFPGFNEGSEGHRSLCRQAAAWMVQMDLDPFNQLSYVAGRADVKAVERPLVAECGNVNPEKVHFALHYGWSVLLVPYTRVDLGLLCEPVVDPNTWRPDCYEVGEVPIDPCTCSVPIVRHFTSFVKSWK